MRNFSVMLVLLAGSASAATNCGFEKYVSQTTFESLFPTSINPANIISSKKIVLSSSVNVDTVDFSTTVINLGEYPSNWGTFSTSMLKSDLNDHQNPQTVAVDGEQKTYNPKTYYTYSNIVSAYNALVKKQPLYVDKFACNSNDLDNKREVAAFFANSGQETNGGTPPLGTASDATAKVGLAYGFAKIVENPSPYDHENENISHNLYNFYCNPTTANLCTGPRTSFCDNVDKYCLNAGVTSVSSHATKQALWFYGRGPKQLSYFSNYLVYGSYIEPGNPTKLAEKPEILATDPIIGWETAFAFWAIPYEQQTSTSDGYIPITTVRRNSMHDVLMKASFEDITGSSSSHGTYGFGQTINVINGGVECNKDAVNATSLNRINNYIEALYRLGVTFDSIKVDSTTSIKYDDIKKNIDNPIKYINERTGEAYYNTAPLPTKYYRNQPKIIYLCYDSACNVKEELDCSNFLPWQ